MKQQTYGLYSLHRYNMRVRCGPDASIQRWVCVWWVRKQFVFGRNALQIAIFWYFIVLPPYPLPKIYDGWVRRER
jgi:hypothetical protein